MKNQIKYLLSFLVVGVGLLFNQSFAGSFTVDVVSPAGAYTTNNGGANYSYVFQNRLGTNPDSGFLGYTSYKYGNTISSSISVPVAQNYSCPGEDVVFYDSAYFSTSGYVSWCDSARQNVAHYNRYNRSNYDYAASMKYASVILGQGTDFGRNFVTIATTSDSNVPVYGFSTKYLTTTDYMQVSDQYSNYYRFFYNLCSGSVCFDKYNFDINGQFSSGGDFTSKRRQYFYPRGTRTNYGYIIDDGSSYTKYKHFGLFGMGYSYVYGKVGQQAKSLSRNTLGFRTVGDNVQVYLDHVGDVDYSTFSAYSSGYSNISRNGLLLLRAHSVLGLNQDDGVYLLSKDPNNTHRVLYEHWSCASDNVDLMIKGTGGCLKLDGGFLTYNGSENVLPFNSINDTYSITGINNSYPLLYDLTNGGNGITSMRGYSDLAGSNCLYINNTSRCYGFTSNSSVNVIEQYLNGGSTTATTSLINQYLLSQCLSDSQFALTHSVICNGINQTFTGTYALGSGYYYQYTTDSSGNISIEIIDQAGLFENHTGYVWIQDSNGNWVTNCDGGRCNPNPTNVSGSQYLSGDILVEDYYNGTGLFFACPYPYDSVFTANGWDLKLGKFDILGPINCFISAFQHGKSFNFLDSAGLYDFGPLIQGTTDNHKTLYMFFDFLLIMWFVVFFTFIYKRFK